MIKTIFRHTTALWLMFFWGMWSSGLAWAERQDVRILFMNDREVALEFTIPPFEMETVQGPDGRYQRIRVQGWTNTSRVGYPELPFTAVLVQIPQEGTVRVQILEDEHETLMDYRIYPVPRLVLSEKGEPTTEFIKDADAYSFSVFYPGELAVIGSPSVVRGTSVARLEIYPFQWNSMTKELCYHKKIRIMVRFENPIFQPSIINSGSG